MFIVKCHECQLVKDEHQHPSWLLQPLPIPIDHDDYIDVLFYIGSKTPLHMNIMILLYIGRKPIVDDIYVYIC